jgi:hypothetical protein
MIHFRLENNFQTKALNYLISLCTICNKWWKVEVEGGVLMLEEYASAILAWGA